MEVAQSGAAAPDKPYVDYNELLERAEVSAFWAERRVADAAEPHTFKCSNCGEDVKARIAGPNAKNAGKAFLACYEDRGGCGTMWSLLEAKPGKQYCEGKNVRKPGAAKRARVEDVGGTGGAGGAGGIDVPQQLTALWEELKNAKMLAHGQAIQIAELTVSMQEAQSQISDLQKTISSGLVG